MKIQIRCSELSKIMTDPQKKTEKLSTGAKSLIEDKVKWMLLFPDFDSETCFSPDISSKYLTKGNQCEQDSIDLINEVNFANYTKNEERKTSKNGILSGSCDIFTGGAIIDIKSCWSLATYPFFKHTAEAKAIKDGYDWQIYGYQYLWGVDKGQIAFCMVSTPYELCSYEDSRIHEVDHIDVGKRVVVADFNLTTEIADKIESKLYEAKRYFDLIIGELK